jgi:NDP-sugar pyrophosphorylase family protein
MRRMALAFAVVALSPTLVYAWDMKGDCVIDVKEGDVVARGKDVVVEAGKRVNDAVAVDGNVIVRRGAHVKSAVAVNGSVTIESGAKVTGSVISFGGKVTVAPDAKVEGSRLVLGDGIKVKSEDGKDVSLNFSIGGEELGALIASKITGAARDCRIVDTTDAGNKKK